MSYDAWSYVGFIGIPALVTTVVLVSGLAERRVRAARRQAQLKRFEMRQHWDGRLTYRYEGREIPEQMIRRHEPSDYWNLRRQFLARPPEEVTTPESQLLLRAMLLQVTLDKPDLDEVVAEPWP